MSLNDNVTAVLLPKHQLFAMFPANFAEGNGRCAPTVLTLPTSSKPRRAVSPPPRPHNPPPCHAATKIQHVSQFPHTLQISLYQRGTLSLPCLIRNHTVPRLLQLPQQILLPSASNHRVGRRLACRGSA
eukprot:scaffold7702_cov74-Phaeocystis_antarctica.AAC.2